MEGIFLVPSHLQDRVVWGLPGSLIANIRVQKAHTLVGFRNWFYTAIKKELVWDGLR